MIAEHESEDGWEYEWEEYRPDAAEVANRVLALIAIIHCAEARSCDLSTNFINQWVVAHDVYKKFTSAEMVFYNSKVRGGQDVIDFSWRVEALVPLLWSLSKIDDLPGLNEPMALSDIDAVKEILDDPESFILNATLRPADEIQAAHEQLWHHLWCFRHDQRLGIPPLPEIHPNILQERKYGAAWLIGLMNGDDWDSVNMDT